MGLLGWIFYMFLSIVFFLILLVIDNKYKITKLEKIIISLLLLLIVAGMMKRYVFSHTEQVFFIFVFLFIDLLLFLRRINVENATYLNGYQIYVG